MVGGQCWNQRDARWLARVPWVVAVWLAAAPFARATEPNPYAVLELASGRRIVLELFAADAPDTVSNFVRLVRDRFYDGLLFHRVEDWVVQGGCPEGDGTGGPPWRIEFEDSGHKSVRGAVGMALEPGAPNSAGSQFYILKADTPRLDEGVQRYCVFAQVVRGMDVVDHTAVGDAIATARIVSAAELPPASAGAPPGAGGKQ